MYEKVSQHTVRDQGWGGGGSKKVLRSKLTCENGDGGRDHEIRSEASLVDKEGDEGGGQTGHEEQDAADQTRPGGGHTQISHPVRLIHAHRVAETKKNIILERTFYRTFLHKNIQKHNTHFF